MVITTEDSYMKFRNDTENGVYEILRKVYADLGYPQDAADDKAQYDAYWVTFNMKHLIQEDWSNFCLDCEKYYHGYSDLAYQYLLENEVNIIYGVADFYMIAVNIDEIMEVRFATGNYWNHIR